MDFGKELKNHRLANNLSLLDLERATGISNQNLSRWERDIVSPSMDYCIILANFYKISLDELVGRENFKLKE